MLGEFPRVPKTVQTESQAQSSQTSRTMSMVVDPQNKVDECQQFQTNQESLVDDLVLPFPLDDGVSRCLAPTTRNQSRDNHIDGPYHLDIDGQTHTHGYNTRAKLIMLPKGVAPWKSSVEVQ